MVLQQVEYPFVIDLQKRAVDVLLLLLVVLAGQAEQFVNRARNDSGLVLVEFEVLKKGGLVAGFRLVQGPGASHQLLPVVAEHGLRLA